jgi:Mg2+ and Co2+ transporter CorA
MISFLGLLIVALTFLVKEVLRDKAKDEVSSLESTRNALILKFEIDRLQQSIYYLTKNPTYHEPSSSILSTLDDFPAQFKKLVDAVNDKAVALYNLRVSARMLYEKLPKDIRKTHPLEDKQTQAILDILDFENATLSMFVPPKTLQDASKQLDEVIHLLNQFVDALNHYDKNTRRFLELFESEVASTNRHLRTLNYLSFYLFYPAGVIMGILGQLAGVKPPDGD